LDVVSDNNLSNNDGGSLVEVVSRSQQVAIQSNRSDFNKSSSAWDVEENSSSDSGERSSSEENISVSNNVDDPLGVEVAVVQEVIVGLVEQGRIDGDNVLSVSGVVAGHLKSTIDEASSDVGSAGSVLHGDSSVAVICSVEPLVQASRVRSARSSDSCQLISRSIVGSSDEDVFLSAWVLVNVVSKRPDLTSSHSPVGISSNNEGVWSVSIRSVDGPQFKSNTKAVNINVSLDSDSSFNISSVAVQVSKGNNIVVLEGNDLVLEWEQKAGSRNESWAGVLKVGAEVGRWGRWRWGNWLWWADKSVDLVG